MVSSRICECSEPAVKGTGNKASGEQLPPSGFPHFNISEVTPIYGAPGTPLGAEGVIGDSAQSLSGLRNGGLYKCIPWELPAGCTPLAKRWCRQGSHPT